MAIADFIHLKVRSAYSLTEGANKVDKVVALAKANAMPAVAVTDRNNLFGALEFAQYAVKGGHPADHRLRPRASAARRRAASPRPASSPPADWLTLLVQNEAGYLNLMRLVSRAHLEFKTGSLAALPLDELDGHTDGLLALTGSTGSGLGRLLAAGQAPAATHQLERLQKLFDGRLYIELQRHGEDDERRIEGPLLDLAYASGLPLVGDQRRPLPQGVDVRGARRAALHRAGRAYRGSQPPPRDAPSTSSSRPPRCARCSPTCRRPATTRSTIAQRCAFMPAPRKPILPRYTKLAGRAEKRGAEEMAERGLDGAEGPRPAGAGHRRSRRTRSGSPTSST